MEPGYVLAYVEPGTVVRTMDVGRWLALQALTDDEVARERGAVVRRGGGQPSQPTGRSSGPGTKKQATGAARRGHKSRGWAHYIVSAGEQVTAEGGR